MSKETRRAVFVISVAAELAGAAVDPAPRNGRPHRLEALREKCGHRAREHVARSAGCE